MADESYGSVGTPRIYVDYVQYAKAIGMVKYYYGRYLDNVTGEYSDAWDFNPAKTTTYQATGGAAGGQQYQRLGVVFNNSDLEVGEIPSSGVINDSLRDLQFRNLLSTINYFGLLNHNLGEYFNNANNPEVRLIDLGNTAGHSNDFQIVGHNPDINDIGYSLFGVNYFSYPDLKYLEGLYIQIKAYTEDDPETENTESGIAGTYPLLNLGTITAGRSFDLPHSANLSLNQTISYDGVQSKRTIGGSDLTQVNYLRPKWGDLAPWTNVDLNTTTVNDNDFSTAGFQGRRSWDLSFSYISKEDMFPRSYSNNTAGYYDYDDTQEFDDGDNSTGLYTENVVNNWLNLTLGGQISHILQPDKDKPTDFAIVKMDKNSLQITQQAPMLYQFKVKLVEQF